MTLTLIALGIFFYIADNSPEDATSIGWIPLVSLCTYIIFFAIGYGPVPWLMISEVYTKEYNAIASPLSGAFNWGLAFLVTMTFTPISDAIGKGETFWLFAVLNLIGVIFTFILVPETKGKTFDEIQRMLNGEKAK
jgi:facilitated trehalose transporter